MLFADARRSSTTCAASSSTRSTTSRTPTGARSGRRSSSRPRPRSCLVSLSATVSNAEDFGRWIEHVRGTTAARRREAPARHPAPPLRPRDPSDASPGSSATFATAPPTPSGRARRPAGPGAPRHGQAGRPGARSPRLPPTAAEVVELPRRGGPAAGHLLHLLPGRLRRRHAPVPPGRAAAHDRRGAAPDPRRRRRPRRGALRRRPAAARLRAFVDALEAGFAAAPRRPRAAVPPGRRALLRRGDLLKVVFATETLALGINMPARTVVVERFASSPATGHVDLTSGEYTQLTGRAGRRGIDTIGHAFVLWTPATPSPWSPRSPSARRRDLRILVPPDLQPGRQPRPPLDPPDDAHRLVRSSFGQWHPGGAAHRASSTPSSASSTTAATWRAGA